MFSIVLSLIILQINREYYAEMIELLALLCEGDNHLTESDCQELIPLVDSVKVIRTEGYSRRIQAAVIHFISQVQILQNTTRSIGDSIATVKHKQSVSIETL
jgi:hypothetical protein